MHLGEVLIDRLGKEVSDIVSLANLLADVGGGDVDLRYLDHGDIGMAGEFAVGVAGTGIDVNLVVLEDELPVAPPLEGLEVVGAHDKAELLVAVFVAEVGEGKHGVGGYGEMEFDVAGTHAVVVVDGEADHLQPLLVGEEGFAFLERVLGRDDKPHLVEVAMGKHGITDDEVPDMDGVERAEEKTYFAHGCNVCLTNEGRCRPPPLVNYRMARRL